MPIQYNLTSIPMFSLFGDGLYPHTRCADRDLPGTCTSRARPTATVGRRDAGVLLQAAIDAGLDADRNYVDLGSVWSRTPPTTTFTLTVDGETHTSNVYALGELRRQGRRRDDARRSARRARSCRPSRQKASDLELAARAARRRTRVRTNADAARASSRATTSRTPPPHRRRSRGRSRPALPRSASQSRPDSKGCVAAPWTAPTPERSSPQAEQANQLTPWTSDGDRYGLRLQAAPARRIGLLTDGTVRTPRRPLEFKAGLRATSRYPWQNYPGVGSHVTSNDNEPRAVEAPDRPRGFFDDGRPSSRPRRIGPWGPVPGARSRYRGIIDRLPAVLYIDGVDDGDTHGRRRSGRSPTSSA